MLELSIEEIDEVQGAGIVKAIIRDVIIGEIWDNRVAIGNAIQSFATWSAQYYQPPYYA